jgi:hypothetical protein
MRSILVAVLCVGHFLLPSAAAAPLPPRHHAIHWIRECYWDGTACLRTAPASLASRWELSEANARPLIAYLDPSGKALDWLFDGLIIYDCFQNLAG